MEWFERIALKHVYYHMWNRSPVYWDDSEGKDGEGGGGGGGGSG